MFFFFFFFVLLTHVVSLIRYVNVDDETRMGEVEMWKVRGATEKRWRMTEKVMVG